ncbi:hypothetical protein GBAR_LOCUS11384 [Geodia barretti]|uniref:Uncharacterized protein n=1 Tax=Geodia barretti TaxID=519541 RepID=A0AA35RW30_GEOBA|nr:hypothetical protein GBAR_LOCUS11384 [Geodia barretti]
MQQGHGRGSSVMVHCTHAQTHDVQQCAPHGSCRVARMAEFWRVNRRIISLSQDTVDSQKS